MPEHYALPYPHERNDCDGCRERDADVRAWYDGLQCQHLLWCQRCAGPALTQLTLSGYIVTVRHRIEYLGCENGCTPEGDGKSCGLCQWGIPSSPQASKGGPHA